MGFSECGVGFGGVFRNVARSYCMGFSECVGCVYRNVVSRRTCYFSERDEVWWGVSECSKSYLRGVINWAFATVRGLKGVIGVWVYECWIVLV